MFATAGYCLNFLAQLACNILNNTVYSSPSTGSKGSSNSQYSQVNQLKALSQSLE
ncbi:hypothetical protein TOT_010000460 [Theileria orientalis strain Shintoku]|uniref:Uncharacterized protein n=1 Tax=Theileria orientalis strain Shintoku TaxID=869250 RepID=J4D5I9_THEOR|nr:hypothetical protein TOT_010000460 [Theileria orientalis strain Shintoku]BAM38995.1 hypothetical protein TOT_010000460 [Theileria orientalis strain Shintoku]|eukprot:XP_009689296.1 hypothetical protein TOT_010000460 [Theileria orientalis strain Shintoku]